MNINHLYDVTATEISRGQSRPYGPHVTVTHVKFTEGGWRHFELNKGAFLNKARHLVTDRPMHSEVESSMESHFAGYVESVEWVDDNTVAVTEHVPFCD